MRAKLIALDQSPPKRKIVVRKFPMTIGRSPGAGICLEDRWASREHCEIDEVAGTLVVRDLGSTHGTYVNGLEITEAHLMPGDKLTIGLSSFLTQYKQRKPDPSAEDTDKSPGMFRPSQPR